MAGAAAAQPALAAAPVLSVCGAVDGTAADGCRVFTLRQLEQMPQASITTATPWHSQPLTYSGVPVQALLSSLNARGRQLRLLALNDYAVTVEARQLGDNGAILATARDGRPMPISDKGPIFVMFPFDSDPKLRADSIYLMAVWQLCRIDVL